VGHLTGGISPAPFPYFRIEELQVRVLLLATDFGSQYRALRCVAALDAEVFVLGSGAARSLALSRYCKRFVPFSFQADDTAAAAAVEAIAAELDIDMLVPADLSGAEFLARAKPHLHTPTFPLSDAAALEAIGTKDRFAETCRRLGVPHPAVTIFQDKAQLLQALFDGRIALPLMLKPINRAGGVGVTRIDEANAIQTVASLNYAPILAQTFVEGTDRCISLFCRGGVVLKQVVYEHGGGCFRFFDDAALAHAAARFVSALNLSGLINFDARIDRHGKIWMIECNPRFTFNMDVAMVAGINFANLTGTQGSPRVVASQEIRIPKALLRALLRFRQPRAADLRMLLHWLKDPLMFALVSIGYQQHWRLPLFEKVMTSGKCAG
jgi:predicted ATP-grasp superfamily ATP-dependent carboligase